MQNIRAFPREEILKNILFSPVTQKSKDDPRENVGLWNSFHTYLAYR